MKVLGYGQRDEVPYMVMELIAGDSLKDLLKRRGTLPWEEARGIAAQVAEGLDAAHRAGIIHRDVKPSNILFAADGTVKLADFGIARAEDVTRLTGSSAMLGTPWYMAPEGNTSEAADYYSLGCVLYEMLTGSVPFDGPTPAHVLLAHQRGDVDLGRVDGRAGLAIGLLMRKVPGERAMGRGVLGAGTSAVPAAASAARSTASEPTIAPRPSPVATPAVVTPVPVPRPLVARAPVPAALPAAASVGTHDVPIVRAESARRATAGSTASNASAGIAVGAPPIRFDFDWGYLALSMGLLTIGCGPLAVLWFVIWWHG